MILATLIVTTIGLIRRWWRRRGTGELRADRTSGDFPAASSARELSAGQPVAERAERPTYRRSILAAGAAAVSAGIALLGITFATATFVEC